MPDPAVERAAADHDKCFAALDAVEAAREAERVVWRIEIGKRDERIAILINELAELHNVEAYAKEGWDWLTEVLDAIGPGTTVFNYRDKLEHDGP